MMKDLDTSKISIAEKAKMLIGESMKQTAGATEKDLGKLTPRGRQIVKNARHAARQMFARSGDNTWLKISREIGKQWGHKKKPAPEFETK